jgi:hypothetical protein
MADREGMKQFQIRVTEPVYEELQAMVERLQASPNHRATPVTFSHVVRMALSLGLEEMKRRYPTQEGPSTD